MPPRTDVLVYAESSKPLRTDSACVKVCAASDTYLRCNASCQPRRRQQLYAGHSSSSVAQCRPYVSSITACALRRSAARLQETFNCSFCYRMDWTDLHFRQLCRLVSKHTWLWTEMVVDQTLVHNPDTDRSGCCLCDINQVLTSTRQCSQHSS